MTTTNLNQVKSRLSHYARLVKTGETIILCDRNKPFAEIRPLHLDASKKPLPKRQLGTLKGWFPVPDDFNTPDLELENSIADNPIFLTASHS